MKNRANHPVGQSKGVLSLCPGTIFSLWDIMRLAHIGSLILLVEATAKCQRETDWRRGATLSKKRASFMLQNFKRFANHWPNFGWDDICYRLERVIYILEHGNDVNWDRPRVALSQLTQLVNTALGELSMAISLTLDEYHFAMVDKEKRNLVEDGDLFGKPVSEAFPSAKEDIKEAGHCMAFDLHTAAVFYLMRIAERGMRALAIHLKVKIEKTKKAKKQVSCPQCNMIISGAIPSKSKLVPLDYAIWEDVLQALERKNKNPKNKTKGAKRATEKEFYHLLILELTAFKDIWRNEVSHCRRAFGEPEANQVYPHVMAFMQRLAKAGIKETN